MATIATTDSNSSRKMSMTPLERVKHHTVGLVVALDDLIFIRVSEPCRRRVQAFGALITNVVATLSATTTAGWLMTEIVFSKLPPGESALSKYKGAIGLAVSLLLLVAVALTLPAKMYVYNKSRTICGSDDSAV